jgi:hypothetical protein
MPKRHHRRRQRRHRRNQSNPAGVASASRMGVVGQRLNYDVFTSVMS